MGFSTKYSSGVPLILNLKTESISPHYHMVFDNSFITGELIPEDQDPPSFWNKIELESHGLYCYMLPNTSMGFHLHTGNFYQYTYTLE